MAFFKKLLKKATTGLLSPVKLISDQLTAGARQAAEQAAREAERNRIALQEQSALAASGSLQDVATIDVAGTADAMQGIDPLQKKKSQASLSTTLGFGG